MKKISDIILNGEVWKDRALFKSSKKDCFNVQIYGQFASVFPF